MFVRLWSGRIGSFCCGIALYDPEVGARANQHLLSLPVPHDYVVTREGYELPIRFLILRIAEFYDTPWTCFTWPVERVDFKNDARNCVHETQENQTKQEK
jgi:hypothetical protein